MEFLILPAIVVIVIILLTGLRTVDQYERGLVIRFGRVVGERSPGLTWIIPLVDGLFKMDMQVQVTDMEPQQVITKDSVSIDIRIVAYYRVVDAPLNYTEIDDDELAITQLAQAIMRKTVGKHELADLLEHGENVSSAIQGELSQSAHEWGLDISRIEIMDIELPESMRRVMASQAESKREATAKVTAAEGEKNSAVLLREAADLMSEKALELRRLQTWREIGADNATVIVVTSGSDLANTAAASAAGRSVQA